MQLYILAGKKYAKANADVNHYDLIGVIDESESVLWNKKFNDAGECEIYIPCNKEILSLLRSGNYVYRYDDDMFCKIGKFEIKTDVENGDYIIAPAPDICNILSNRIVRWQIVFSGTVGQFIKKLLTDNVINPAQTHRAIPNFVFDESNLAEFSDKIEVSAFTNDLLQTIISTCKTFKIGFRVSYDIETRKLVFRLKKGRNKASAAGGEYVEFSPSFANILSSHYIEDDTEYKNVVYVGYKSANKDDNTTYLYSYPPNENDISGEDRCEIYVDGTNISRDITLDELRVMFPDVKNEGNGYVATIDGKLTAVALSDTSGSEEKITVTDTTYFMLIRAIAEQTLAERVEKQSFEGDVDTVDTYKYKVDYDIGDIVNVKNEYGLEAEAQITEVMESDDAEDGYAIEPKFEYLN